MNIDDIVYLVCLLSCIAFGYFSRRIQDDSQRKLLGTAFGVLIVVIVSGIHVLHCLISFSLCALAVQYAHPSKCHIISFAIMFGYLVFFRTTTYFGLPSPPGHTNMIQMILTLKAAGIAFEKAAAYKKVEQRKKEVAERSQPSTSEQKDLGPIVELTDYDLELQTLTTVEMFHYCFNYIGVLTGPYYRYRTYRDYFDMPFKNYANCKDSTLEKLKYTVMYGVIYLVANSIWPLEYSLTDEFANERHFLYRIFYVWPNFLIFRMRIYIGITLSECVCTASGFGAYPVEAGAIEGEGPKKQYDHLKRDAEKREYSFITIKNLRAYETETCLTIREAMKNWNVCVQYWLAVNIYKQFPSKKYRTVVTLLTSSFWHGFMPGHYLCIMGALFYCPVEDMFTALFRKDATGTKLKIVNALFCIHKYYGLGYLGTAFQLLTIQNIWKYYSSIYQFGYVYWAVMAVIAVVLTKRKRAAEKRKKRELEKRGTEAAVAGELSKQKEKAQ
ncbi:lysophospholipid acyltransferase 7 [Episyrphus balteatus]|uniref:lysophospholipid acyltransferase 7 n=1 Tax=Episyrphus balteatus TaxID=286459 RepID=UPI0024854D0B|nr:lysophospholipid acyltransferase 7 [Episyrphus balteatus]